MTDIGRNSPCACGSGRKYKHCCGAADKAASTTDPSLGAGDDLEAALAHLRSGRLSEANSLCARLLSRDPDSLKILKLSVDVLLRLGKADVALKRIQRAVRLAPNDPQFRCTLGDVYRALNRSAEAITEFFAAWRLAPEQPSGFDRLIATCMQEGRLEDGVAYFRAGLATDSYLSASNSHLLPALATIGLPDEVKASTGANPPIDPLFVVACNALGTAANRLRNVPPPSRACRNGRIVDPTCASIYLDLFQGLFDHGRYPEALACMQALATVEPQNPTATHSIAALSGVPLDRAAPDYCTRLFDTVAHKFDSHLVGRLRYDVPDKLAAMARQLAQPSEASWDVLDLGCGTGLSGQSFQAFATTLVGVDLSAVMLEHAQRRQVYSRLEQADIVDFLRREAGDHYDLVVAADVFIYLGRLDSVFEGLYRSLRVHGRALFSIEALAGATVASATPGKDYALTISGRFAHAPEYIENLAARCGFVIERKTEAILRTEGDRPSRGWLYALRRE